MIKAFSLLREDLNACLVILGEGRMRERLERLIAELNLQGRVFLPGYVADPYPWYRSADLFVLSSLWEGFGNVVVEALECGVPIVSTEGAGGPREILDNGRYGRLVPPGNPALFAKAMTEALMSDLDRESLIKRSQAFSVTEISKQYLDYFESVSV